MRERGWGSPKSDEGTWRDVNCGAVFPSPLHSQKQTAIGERVDHARGAHVAGGSF